MSSASDLTLSPHKFRDAREIAVTGSVERHDPGGYAVAVAAAGKRSAGREDRGEVPWEVEVVAFVEGNAEIEMCIFRLEEMHKMRSRVLG